MPILDEERHLAESVGAILAQDWPGELEVILALGPSSDRTDEVAATLAAADPRVVLVDNPTGRTPEGLNAAITKAQYPVVARVDGHGILSPGYLRTAAATLAATGAANVGGIMDAEGTTDFERAVACAMRSKIGVGGVKFKQGGSAGPADTVYLGVFDRSWLDRIGGYDPRYTRAQDWEMNYRIRQAGGLVWFTPDLRVTYRPRGTFRALARQYRQYGQWRRVVAREHPGSINLRYLAPPVALVGIAGGLVGGFAWAPLWIVPAGYLAAVTVGGVAICAGEGVRVRALAPGVLATMHLSWGWGFLTSRVRLPDATPADIQPTPSDRRLT